jgi:MoaA/NifB/PqqE/SkfB family radical SAM enzyme
VLKKLGVLVVNNVCNANCSFCAGKIHRTKSFFNCERFEEVLENNKEIEEILISGAGEPLTDPLGITEALITIEKQKLKNLTKVKLYTNGILLPSRISNLEMWKQLGLTSLYVTIHNLDPLVSQKSLNSIMPPPSPQEIIKIAKQVGIEVRANIPISYETISTQEELTKTTENLLALGFQQVCAWVIRDKNDKRIPELVKLFNIPETTYDETKQTLFPNGELRPDWCN